MNLSVIVVVLGVVVVFVWRKVCVCVVKIDGDDVSD